ncbi:atrial natriuretic peptide receptor 1-like [Paramacrobiotus metropolitanus]|uniref:atrial natriuretic peptide receptor 1-like n=1 Tax=Paramacrobiotus metropolitanus TaxID=2943436 RepID=UPI0024465A16|nr:atrial natriuretic peptide receptor 1-like [Paramacrobiotus metropolitanus]
MKGVFQIQAEAAGMTNGEFVFFFPEFLRGTSIYGTLSWENHDEYDAVARRAFGVLLLITYYEHTTDNLTFDADAFRAELKQRSQRDYNYTYGPNEQPNIVAVAMYRCFQMFGMVLNESLSSNQSWNPRDGAAFIQKFWGRTFTLPGESIYIDRTGERLDDLVLYTFDSLSGTRTAVLRQDKSTFGIVPTVPYSPIKWPIKWPPPSRPVCGFFGNDGPCSLSDRNDVLIKGVSCGGAAVIALLLLILIRYIRIWKRLHERPWVIDPADVCFFPTKPRSLTAPNQAPSVIASTATVANGTLLNLHPQSSLGEHFVQVRYAGYKDRKIVLQTVELINDEKTLTSLLAKMYPLTHVNVNQFYGILRKGEQDYLVSEYCPRGSLKMLLEHNKQFKESDFLQGLLSDVLSGMKYIHDSTLHFHGSLDSTKCWLGHNFTVKVAEVGFGRLRADEPMYLSQQPSFTEEKKKAVKDQRCQAEDVLAVGLIAIEIFRPVVWRVTTDLEMGVNYLECAPAVKDIVRRCVKERYQERPGMSSVERSFAKVYSNRSFMERVLRRMEKYSRELEDAVAERTEQLNVEKRKCDRLLLEMLPAQIVEALRHSRSINPETFDSVTVSFTDISGFAEFVCLATPLQVVAFLNDSHSLLDGVVATYDVYKVETINDSYLVASGLPQRNGTRHAEEICRLAKQICTTFAGQYATRHLSARTGIHSGPCVTAVIGTKRPRYCLFGDTVNTASRMETSGEGGRVHLSLSTASLIGACGLPVHFRAILDIKGKGHMQTFWLQLD